MSLALAAALLAATSASAEGSPAAPAKPAPTKAAAAKSAPAKAAPAVRTPAAPARGAGQPKPVEVAPVVVRPPAAIVVSVSPPLSAWRSLDPENTLLIDTDKGQVVIELRPEFAPLAVARIKRLARGGIYDNLQFHRVVDGFVAQTGAPGNRDGGKSQEPDLPAEFTFRLGADIPRAVLTRPQGESAGFIGAQPYAAVDEIRMASSPDRRVTAWGAFCAGVVAMGRNADPNGGNSEFFIMRGATRSLDRSYSVVGRVVTGLDVVRALVAGDPPMQPSRMLRARVLADLPEPARPQVAVLNTLSPEFRALVDQVRAIKGADFSICDVEAPVRVTRPEAPARPSVVKHKRTRRPAATTKAQASPPRGESLVTAAAAHVQDHAAQ